MATDNEWVEFRKSVYETKSKSEDDFEKYITLIASGALALSLTLIDKLVPIKDASYIWLLVVGWCLFSVTLFINLLSHFLSKMYSEKTISEVDTGLEKDIILKNIDSRNSKIDCLNIISIISIFLGILSIILFVTLNIYSMNNNNNPKTNPPNQNPKPLTEEKGRTIPKPPASKPSQAPKK